MGNAAVPELGFDLENGTTAEDLPPLCDGKHPEIIRPSLNITPIDPFVQEVGDISLLNERCHEIHAQVVKVQKYLDAGRLRKSWEEHQAVVGKAQAECPECWQPTLCCVP